MGSASPLQHASTAPQHVSLEAGAGAYYYYACHNAPAPLQPATLLALQWGSVVTLHQPTTSFSLPLRPAVASLTVTTLIHCVSWHCPGPRLGIAAILAFSISSLLHPAPRSRALSVIPLLPRIVCDRPNLHPPLAVPPHPASNIASQLLEAATPPLCRCRSMIRNNIGPMS